MIEDKILDDEIVINIEKDYSALQGHQNLCLKIYYPKKDISTAFHIEECDTGYKSNISAFKAAMASLDGYKDEV